MIKPLLSCFNTLIRYIPSGHGEYTIYGSNIDNRSYLTIVLANIEVAIGPVVANFFLGQLLLSYFCTLTVCMRICTRGVFIGASH